MTYKQLKREIQSVERKALAKGVKPVMIDSLRIIRANELDEVDLKLSVEKVEDIRKMVEGSDFPLPVKELFLNSLKNLNEEFVVTAAPFYKAIK